MITNIRVRTETRKKLDDLVELLRAKGWNLIGVTREDGPTLSSALDEAVVQLLARARKGK